MNTQKLVEILNNFVALRKAVVSGCLFSISLTSLLGATSVARLIIPGTLPSVSVAVILRVALVGKLVISGILFSSFMHYAFW